MITNYADIATGFIRRLGFIGPLISFVAPELKLTVLIKLHKPDRTIFIDTGLRPLNIVVDGPQKQADVMLTLDAEMFHYMLWGKITFPKALNESIILLEIKSGSLPDIPIIETPKPKVPRAPGPNPIYEMYLVNIGAGHLIDEQTQLSFPPPPSELRNIELAPQKKGGLLEKSGMAMTYILAFISGLFLRLFLKLRKPPKFMPPKIEYLSFDEVFKPLPPAKGFKIVKMPLMKSLFSRVDILRVTEAGVSGLAASGALKKPLELVMPLSQRMRLAGM